MMLTIQLTIYGIMLALALLHIGATTYIEDVRQRRTAAREKYREHIDNLVEELFPASAKQTPTVNDDLQRREAKSKMVANIRTYFNRRKNAVSEIEQFMLEEMC